MRVDRLGYTLQVDLYSKHSDRLQAVQPVLRRDRQRRRLNLQLPDLADAERNDQEDQARERDEDAYEHDGDGEDARDAERMKSYHRRLDEECDRRPEDEGAEKVPQQEEDNDRDPERRESERDLRVAAPALRVDRPGRGSHASWCGGTLDLFLMRGSVLRGGSHVTQTRAV